ncbi:uncharacterized protein PFL1_02506 [Pseudozyma flocculosa PF-1]|uniref:Related to Glucose oxidase n=2 Tax=Pseudozyma flocculosa TaxID=84751 RepID=A0A5C3EY37_9BASI|nr:uncharacterized protein PFL1_02506 [Pseudozyma flocculosa PF-1]EPQ29833.1 hypothetical protein PFL1_02506 [Pseudozyma flocculosa PF-1]SPO37128.1 related to Glucose oxidase [Pseudozyma flocculosa]
MKISASFARLSACLSLALAASCLLASTGADAAVVTSQLSSVTGQEWDYVIVGAGLTGLVVGKRLADGGNAKVLVIEAGNDDRANPDVSDVGRYGSAFGTGMDWSFSTVQQGLSGNTKTLRAGKTIGGSTSINGAAWNRGHRSQYDNLATLVGDQGFNFQGLQAAMNKAESFVPPDSTQKNLGVTYDASAHGSSGPLQITYTKVNGGGSRRRSVSKRMYSGPQQAAFVSSIKSALGVDKVVDQCSGDNNGAAYAANSIQTNGQRSSAASSYLAQSGDNLTVLTGHRGASLAWADGSSSSSAKASGINVQQSQNGPIQRIQASREVILAAGAINTPAILERSGVGASDVVSRLGVRQVVDLPGVGRNLQEQTMNTLGAQANVNYAGGGPSNMIAMPNVYQLLANATAVRDYVNGNLDAWADSLVSQGHVASREGLLKQWQLSVSAIFDDRAPVCELFFDTGYPSNSYGIDTWCLLPFSRGSTHATSTDAFTDPTINPNYFAIPIDMDMQVAALRGGRRILQADPLRSLTYNGETTPGFGHIPDGTNHGLYRRWRDWVLGTDGTGGFSSVSHQIATCSMMPREQGGVVDPTFKVYGTDNVRVVDASALPVQVSAHLSSTLYGLAEKAAEAIQGGQA